MSLDAVKKEIDRFLSSDAPEVLCLKGRWGVGKTYTWNRYLKEVEKSGRLSKERYAYVSLFGLNSLGALKYHIFESTVPREKATEWPTIDSLKQSAERITRKYSFLSNLFPKLSSGIALPAFFLTVRNQFICFDDIERKSKNLDIRDVLGLASMLKEQRGCKVVILMNDSELDKSDKDALASYLEKVTDVSLHFDPTPCESVGIAIDKALPWRSELAKACVSLGISNIRVIKRIEKFVDLIEPLVAPFDKAVAIQAVQSLAVLGWSVFEPTYAPPLEYLIKRRGPGWLFLGKERPAVPPEEAAWNAVLDAVSFSRMDEFDYALLKGLKRGYFDGDEIKSLAAKLDSEAKQRMFNAEFSAAWDKFHSSFTIGEEELSQALVDATLRGAKHISAANISSTVALLKELGKVTEAQKIVQHYVKIRETDKAVFEQITGHFSSDITDPDVRAALEDGLLRFADTRQPIEIMAQMAEKKRLV